MESFHCSSSSFDALNSFQQRRSSSVVVIAENESILSPTFKSMKQPDSKRESKIFQRKRNPTAESSVSFCQNPLFISELVPLSRPTSKSASILPSIKQGKKFNISLCFGY